MEVVGGLFLLVLIVALLVTTNWYELKAAPGDIAHWLRSRNIRIRRPRLPSVSGLFRRTDWEALAREEKR